MRTVMSRLLVVGVLRLIDQDVVDAAVELVEHPLRDALAPHQIAGLQNEIVVVEDGALALERCVAAQDVERQHRQSVAVGQAVRAA